MQREVRDAEDTTSEPLEDETVGQPEFRLSWLNLLKRLLAAVLYFVVSFAVLCLVYPIRERMRWVRYSLTQMLPEYLVMSLIVTCIVVFAVPLLTWWCNRLVIWMSVIIRTATALVMLWIFASTIGMGEPRRWPPSQIVSFFSEMQVIIFAYEYAPIISLLAGVYYWFTFRRRVVTSSPERYATRGRSRERKRDR